MLQATNWNLIWLAIVISSQFYLSAHAQTNIETLSKEAEPLSGHVEKANTQAHIGRPKPQFETKTPTPNHLTESKKLLPEASLFSLQKEAQPGVLGARPGLFDFDGAKTELKEAGPQRGAAINTSLNEIVLPLTESNGEELIHWDEWHRQFIANLYLRFHRANNGEYPGECRILLTVTSSGDISLEGGDDFHSQSEEFQNTLIRSARLLSHSSLLEFPDGSRRQKVQFTMSVKSSKQPGTSSYGWTQQDVEKIPGQAH